MNIQSSGFGSIAGGKAILSHLLPLRLLVFFLFFLDISCGGFQDVEKIEKIKPPPDIEGSLPVEATPKPATSKKHRKKKTFKTQTIRVFETKEARQRVRDYAQAQAFREGEKVTYAFSWFSIKAGMVTLEVRPFVYIGDRKAYHFMGTVKSSATMDLIHSINDWIESYVDVETFYPFKSALHGVETDRLREGLMVFDYESNKIEYWMKRVHLKKGEKEKRLTDTLTPGVLDMFSSAFFLRIQKLEVGKSYHTDIYNEGKRITVDAEVLRKEKLETTIGTFDALVIRPITKFEGILQTYGDSTIWLTDDERHLVLQVETKIKIGYLKGKVIQIEDPEYQLPIQGSPTQP
ncbi:MAG: DUF3108 domain-containing protein [Deltaproteobacteria bacterium]|nr:DUF3108 domain-containing protein [Deltaproteobacteria bacterium]MBI3017068.1 DUF3108 domain-containing protein [Deltaproteobacteria bacterium]